MAAAGTTSADASAADVADANLPTLLGRRSAPAQPAQDAKPKPAEAAPARSSNSAPEALDAKGAARPRRPWWQCGCCKSPDAIAGAVLKSTVQQVTSLIDPEGLGVKMELGKMSLLPASGRIEIGGLTIFNPEGYHSPHMLRAEQVIVDINMVKLLKSKGTHIEVEELAVKDVEVIYEKALTTSNINDVLKRLQGGAASGHEPAKGNPQEDPKESPKDDQKKGKAQPEIVVTLHRVEILKVGAKVASVLTRGCGFRLELGDIVFEDFAKDFGCTWDSAGHLASILMLTVVKSILATVVSREASGNLGGSAEAAEAPCS